MREDVGCGRDRETNISYNLTNVNNFDVKIIYDIGSNNGDDIAYYMLKANKVVAVEANPDLCKRISDRYSSEIKCGTLVVENCAVTDEKSGLIDFYISQANHVLSTLVAPSPQDRDKWKICRVEAVPIIDIIKKHGPPYYIKIDVEGHDESILKSLARAGVKPPFISAESHTLGVFTLLSEQMNYRSFKLVDGYSVSKVYRKRRIFSPIQNSNIEYSFPYHSGGPFGDDVDGPWLEKSTMLKFLALQQLGWKDIHATTTVEPIHMNSEGKWSSTLSSLIKSITYLEAKPRLAPGISDAIIFWRMLTHACKYFVDATLYDLKIRAKCILKRLSLHNNIPPKNIRE